MSLGSLQILYIVVLCEGDTKAGTRENKGGTWAGSERRRGGICERTGGGKTMTIGF